MYSNPLFWLLCLLLQVNQLYPVMGQMPHERRKWQLLYPRLSFTFRDERQTFLRVQGSDVCRKQMGNEWSIEGFTDSLSLSFSCLGASGTEKYIGIMGLWGVVGQEIICNFSHSSLDMDWRKDVRRRCSPFALVSDILSPFTPWTITLKSGDPNW